MIVTKFWAEAESKIIVNERQQTLQRFGWSDISQQDAEINANERLQEAVHLAESGKEVRMTDNKVADNGAEGLPNSEEVISHHDDSVMTRNSYGALCINTPDGLFDDIDFL